LAANKNNRVQEALSKRFRSFLSQDPDGVPPWLPIVAEGDDAGLFLPSDAPWVVHADFGTLVGGIRALLMQALHPGSLAGVQQHSRYEKDPLGRLAGTIRWLTVTTFGSRGAIEKEASRVNRLHERVTGEYQASSGESRPYRAADKDLLLWVHIAFMDSFLRAHQSYSAAPIPGGADAYVSLWSRSVTPLGLDSAPMSEADLIEAIGRFDSELVVTNRTREVVRFIQYPPLPWLARAIYRLLFAAAVQTLEPRYRELLDLQTLPSWFVKPTTRALLKIMRTAIGPESPIEDAAKARLIRIGAWQPSD
jgi:uncharacterized protein (DUF2236 family)